MVAHTQAVASATTDARTRTSGPTVTQAAATVSPLGTSSRTPGPTAIEAVVSVSPTATVSKPHQSHGDGTGVVRREDLTFATPVLIPGDFRYVEVTVVDTVGDPLPVEYVISRGAFNTAAVATGNTAQLALLPVQYSEFMVIAEYDGPENTDYAWYSAAAQEPVESGDKEATVVIDSEPIESPTGGLTLASGVSLGGF